MSWHLNSIEKNKFERVRLLEAHNFNYDLISICETCLTDSSELEVPDLEGYKFIPASHPANLGHAGRGWPIL